jgi:membrane-bound lytic murein transglycosylase B
MMASNRHIQIFVSLMVCLLWWPIAQGLPAQIEAFGDGVAARNGLDRAQVMKILAQGKNLAHEIRPRFQGSAERTWTWRRYSKNFLSKARIDNGALFWREHDELFKRASKTYGIPSAILAAIVGVETNYGKNTGKIRVLDSLYTQAFHYPERAKFGKRELEAFIVLSINEKLDPFTVKGSYAGAMGKPQFIPTSYNKLAIDFDDDNRRDLWNSTADIVGSVANYFAQNRWQPGGDIAFPVRNVNADLHRRATTETAKPEVPDLPLTRWKKFGIKVPGGIDPDQPASLIEYNGANGREYWAGLHNFYVITRYNHSYLYALAVLQLSQQIEAAKRKLESESL